MRHVWQQWGDVIVASLVALPLVALVVVVALAVPRRRRGTPARSAWVRSLTEVGMVAGTLPWLWMIMTPGSRPPEVHLVPLCDLANQLSVGPVFATVQIGGNLLVFAALGFCAPIRFAALARPVRLFALGAAGSALVELLQYQLDLHRVSSVDDVLVNATGAMLAGLAPAGGPALRAVRPDVGEALFVRSGTVSVGHARVIGDHRAVLPCAAGSAFRRVNARSIRARRKVRLAG